MRVRRRTGAAVLAGALAAFGAAGCRCGSTKSTDEERLRRLLDTTKVHVYVGVKAVRAWVFAQHGLCDLSSHAERAFAQSATGAEFEELASLLPRRLQKLPAGSSKYLAGALAALSAGGTAQRYLSRGDEPKAREKIVQMLDATDKLGIEIAEGELLRAYVECRGSKETAVKGLAWLVTLPKRFEKMSKRVRETSTALAEYCRTAAGTESTILRKISLARASLALARAQADRAGASRAVQQTEAYGAGRRLAELLARMTGGREGGVSGTLKGTLKEGLKGGEG